MRTRVSVDTSVRIENVTYNGEYVGDQLEAGDVRALYRAALVKLAPFCEPS